MSDRDFGMLADLIQAPGRDLTGQGIEIAPVQAALFDPDGNPLLVSYVGVLPSMRGALAAIRAFFGERWQPGDVALTNDMDAGAFNACEIVMVAPIHSGAGIIGWSAVRGRIPDFGGWEPGGYSPQAVDRWAEGGRLEPVKLMHAGAYRREVMDLMRLNSRTPASTLTNVRLLAQAITRLGQAFAARADDVRDQAAKRRADELRQAQTALGKLSLTAAARDLDIVAPWLSRSFGNIAIAVGTSADMLNVNLSGSAVAACPLNLGLFAAEDIVVGSVAAACGLDGLMTDALVSRINMVVNGPGLVRAPLPATVGLGRQIAGEALFRALVDCLGGSEAVSEAGWQRYREQVCGAGFDPETGKLTASRTKSLRELQAQEVVA